MRTIQLKSSDGSIFEVKEAIANQSVVIRELLDLNESDSNNDDKILIPLQNVSGRTLAMVIEWIVKHAEEELSNEQIKVWESEFLDRELDVIYEIIMAANYLNVSGLLHSTCQKVADMIAGKQPEEIRRIFNIENDFSPEEEAAIRSQNGWVLEPPAGSKKKNTK